MNAFEHLSINSIADVNTNERSYSSTDDDESIICCLHGYPCELRNPDDDYNYLSRSSSQTSSKSHMESEGYENLIDVTQNKRNYANNNDRLNVPSDLNGYELLNPNVIADMQTPLYVGEMTRRNAETVCVKPATFRLYHRLPSSKKNLSTELPLIIVYQSSIGQYFHYRILCTKDKFGVNSTYMINIIGEPTFPSICALVNFYSTYILYKRTPDLRPHQASQSAKSNFVADCFPWWNAYDKKVESKEYDYTSPSLSKSDSQSCLECHSTKRIEQKIMSRKETLRGQQEKGLETEEDESSFSSFSTNSTISSDSSIIRNVDFTQDSDGRCFYDSDYVYQPKSSSSASLSSNNYTKSSCSQPIIYRKPNIKVLTV